MVAVVPQERFAPFQNKQAYSGLMQVDQHIFDLRQGHLLAVSFPKRAGPAAQITTVRQLKARQQRSSSSQEVSFQIVTQEIEVMQDIH